MAMVSTKQHYLHIFIDMVESTFTALPAMLRTPQLTGTLPMALELE